MPVSAKRVRRQAPFATHDVHRVAEYFDGELEPTYVFVQSVWLPDAFKSVDALAECLRLGDASSTLFMCDHLRQGAISVGARAFAAEADAISSAVVEGQWLIAATLTRGLLVRLTIATRWLKTRLAKFQSAAGAYDATQHIGEVPPVESTTSFYG
jgi:L-rhamnose isomerase